MAFRLSESSRSCRAGYNRRASFVTFYQAASVPFGGATVVDMLPNPYPAPGVSARCTGSLSHQEAVVPRTIRDLMPSDLEFQMFVLDELADELIEGGTDVLKLTIGVTELPIPDRRSSTRWWRSCTTRTLSAASTPRACLSCARAIAAFYNRKHHTRRVRRTV